MIGGLDLEILSGTGRPDAGLRYGKPHLEEIDRFVESTGGNADDKQPFYLNWENRDAERR